MPSNTDFKLEILIADTPVPEYSKNGEHFVECNLSTPVSYMHQQCDVINGEKEVQSWPVTPYRIRIKASPTTDTEYPKYFRVLVDGVKVKGISLDPGESKVIKGFRDGSCIREFLFSMPRFAKDSTDRLEAHRHAAVGKIVVECWDAVLRRSKWSLRSKYLDFKQANKKDSSQVTDGKYTMATSCPGKVVSGRAIHRLVDSWKLQTLRNSITLTYHMSHTLLEKGFTIQSLNIPPENIRMAKRHQHDVASENSGVSNSVVKKEPKDIPDRPAIPEVIDLTEDQGDERSAQELAMDLSMKSGDSERVPTDVQESGNIMDDNAVLGKKDVDMTDVKEIVEDEAQEITRTDDTEAGIRESVVINDGEVEIMGQDEEISISANYLQETIADEQENSATNHEVSEDVEMQVNIEKETDTAKDVDEKENSAGDREVLEDVEMQLNVDKETETAKDDTEKSNDAESPSNPTENDQKEVNVESENAAESETHGCGEGESRNPDGEKVEVAAAKQDAAEVELSNCDVSETGEAQSKDHASETIESESVREQIDTVDKTAEITADIPESETTEMIEGNPPLCVEDVADKETESVVQDEEKLEDKINMDTEHFVDHELEIQSTLQNTESDPVTTSEGGVLPNEENTSSAN